MEGRGSVCFGWGELEVSILNIHILTQFLSQVITPQTYSEEHDPIFRYTQSWAQIRPVSNGGLTLAEVGLKADSYFVINNLFLTHKQICLVYAFH